MSLGFMVILFRLSVLLTECTQEATNFKISFMFSCALTLSDAVCPWFLFLSFKPFDMAPKVGRKFKTKANRTSASSSAPSQVDRVRFLLAESEEIFETLTKFRSIWGERQVVLDELDPSIHRNLVSRN